MTGARDKGQRGAISAPVARDEGQRGAISAPVARDEGQRGAISAPRPRCTETPRHPGFRDCSSRDCNALLMDYNSLLLL